MYLSEAALRIVRDIQPRDESSYLFPGKRASEPLRSIRVPWEHICKAARLNNLQLHDLRHSFASVGAASGLSLPMIGRTSRPFPAEHNRALSHQAASALHQGVDAIGEKIVGAMQSS